MGRWLVALVLLLGFGTARAQPGVTGVIEGRVLDATTHRPAIGWLVVAGTARTHTARDGTFRLAQLLPGEYDVVVRDLAGEVRRTWHVHVDASDDAGELATAFGRRYATEIPLVGLAFDSVLGATPGAANDGYGTGFAGATSLENRYTIDGIDVTGLRYGTLDQPLPIELVQQVRAIYAAAGPDVATSTGALVEVVTKHGTNDWHGSVFATLAPSWLAAAPKAAAAAPPQTISATSQVAYTADAGATLSGPLVKDHVWLFAGFAPVWTRTDYTRAVRSEVDRDQNGMPDLDPKTGFPITQVVDTQTREAPTATYNAIARIDAAVTPEQQGTLTAIVVPYRAANPGIIGDEFAGTRDRTLTSDIGAHWRSRWLDDRIELEASVGWHHSDDQLGAYDPSVANMPQVNLFAGSFSEIAKYESLTAQAYCQDGGRGDPYPLITNCPGPGNYYVGGPGAISHDVEDRKTARLAATTHVEVLGQHAVQVGLDGDQREADVAQIDSGGYFQQGSPGSPSYLIDRFVKVAPLPPLNTTDPTYDHTCSASTGAVACEYLTDLASATETFTASDWAGFVRDAWRVRPDVVIDAGVRYENQRIGYGDAAASAALAYGEGKLPADLIHIDGELAPRVGVTYDPTNDGRSAVFAHWGRYLEQVPLDIAERSGGIATYEQIGSFADVLGGPLARAVPELRGEYSDELVVGARRAFGASLVEATFQDRRLGRAIEDVALYGAPGLTIANPGEGPARLFDPPTRQFDALELSIARRFSRLYLLASYTYSRTYGDYPGSISYADGQIDPNASSQYDVIELLPNRRGLLPQDRPHYFKLDASYTAPLGRRTAIVIGSRIRALSGTPELALASHYLYGPNESVLLPPGAFGRTPFAEALDLHLGVRRALGHGMLAELYADLLNVFDQQQAFAVDNAYASPIANANPISGGAYADLLWAKQIDAAGNETHTPLARNPDFHQPTSYYAPFTARLGFRLSF